MAKKKKVARQKAEAIAVTGNKKQVGSSSKFGWKAWIVVLFLGIFTFMDFSSVLDGGVLLNWDDNTYIYGRLQKLSNNPTEFIFGKVNGTIQPIPNASYWLMNKWKGLVKVDNKTGTQAVSGLEIVDHTDNYESFWWLLLNLVQHSLSVIIVFTICIYFGETLWIAALISFFWGNHPLRVESVAWASELKDVQYIFFGMLSILMYVLYRQQRDSSYSFSQRWVFRSLCFLFFTASLLSKGQAVLLPFLFILIDIYRNYKVGRVIWIERAIMIGVSVCGALIAFLAQGVSKTPMINFSFAERWIMYPFYVLGIYFRKTFQFNNGYMCHYYPYDIDPYNNPDAWVNIAIGFLLLASLIYFWRDTLIRFGLLWFILPIIPFIISPLGRTIIAERYEYLPSFGLIYLLVKKGNVYWGKGLWNSVIIGTLTIVYLVSCPYTTYNRSRIWRNTTTLWADAIKKYPNDAWINAAYGDALFQSNDNFGESMTYLKKTTRLPGYNTMDTTTQEQVLYRIGFTYQISNLDSAIYYCSKALGLYPSSKKTLLCRGVAYSKQHKCEAALSDFRKVLQDDSLNATVFMNIGKVFDTNIGVNGMENLPRTDCQSIDSSIHYYQKSLNINSQQGAVWQRLMYFHFQKHEFKKSLDAALKARSMGIDIPEETIQKLRNTS